MASITQVVMSPWTASMGVLVGLIVSLSGQRVF
jgi:hypothetical protein